MRQSRSARWDPRRFAEALAAGSSIAEVLRKLGDAVDMTGYRRFHAHVRKYGVSTSHMKGQGWRAGTEGLGLPSEPWFPPLEHHLTPASSYALSSTFRLKRRLIRAGLLVPECARCGIREWLGEPLSLELDHVNGDKVDNRIENLRLLCPNCHSQAPTYRGRNARLKRLEREAAQRSQVKELPRYAYCVTRADRDNCAA